MQHPDDTQLTPDHTLNLAVGRLQVGIAFVDKDYPARAAFGIVTRVQDDFCDQSRDAWRAATADNSDAVNLLEAAVAKYQVCPHRP